ncbi:MAG: hypothetical protein OCD02_12120 [Spirochaetaceae bacterium]
MINLIYRVVFYILLLKLTMTLYQRRYNSEGGKKRIASLYQSVVIGALYCFISIVMAKSFNYYLVYIAVFVTISSCIYYRKKLFPYKSKCQNCGDKLKIRQILFIDSQICPNCEIKD